MSKKTAEPYVEQPDAPLFDDPTKPGAITPDSPAAVATVQRQPSTLEIFATLARDPAIPLDRIRQLLDMQREAERWDAEKAFIAAFARLKFPTIKKSAKGHNSKYAPYEQIQAIIDPILAAEGFTLSFTSGEITAQGIPIHGTLSHVQGHSRQGVMYLPRDKSGSMNEIQGVGSTTSYGQRYVAKMMLNLRFVGDDDNADSFSFLDERQTNNIIDMMNAAEMNPESQSKFLEFMKAERVGEIHKRDYEKAMTALNAKARKVRGE